MYLQNEENKKLKKIQKSRRQAQNILDNQVETQRTRLQVSNKREQDTSKNQLKVEWARKDNQNKFITASLVSMDKAFEAQKIRE